jgi:hypothetical protein
MAATYDISKVETELAYIAGIIDGEGTVCIFNSTGKTKGIVYPRGRPILSVCNTDQRIVRWLKEKVGGRAATVRRAQNPRCKQTYVWETGWQHARAVLEACLPYLIIKQDQARLFIEYCKTCKHYGKGKVPPDVCARRQEIIEQVAKLNKRGPPDAMVSL